MELDSCISWMSEESELMKIRNKAIQEYCSKRSECETCKIRGLCDACEGEFTENEELLKLAYNKLYPDSTEDTVNHPNHYASGSIECIDAMESAFGKDAVSNFCLLNAFKYIWRSKKKNGAEDIKKAIWYLEKYLSFISFEKEDNTDENKL